MKTESGNALFLILIAVALFAALSYAVTQSGRGSGGIDKEQVMIDAALYVDYFNEMRSAIIRMRMTGLDVSEIHTRTDQLKSYVTPANVCSTGEGCIFAQEGGGVHFEDQYSMGLFTAVEVVGVGAAGDEVLLLLDPGPGDGLCSALNKGLGLGAAVEESIVDFGLWSTGIADPYPGEDAACFDDDQSAAVIEWFYMVVEANQ